MTTSTTGPLPAPGTDCERGFALAAAGGLGRVGILAEGEPCGEGRPSNPARVRETAAARDLDVLAHLPFPLDLGSPIPEVRRGGLDALDRYLGDLAAMDARKAVVHVDPSRVAADATDEATRDRFVGSAREATATGEDRGTEVRVEHLPLGAGTIDRETMLAPAVDGDWAPTMTTEVVIRGDDYVAASAERLRDLPGHTRSPIVFRSTSLVPS